MAIPRIPLGVRGRMALRYAGIALGALVVFVFALQATFPYNRVKDKAVEALADSFDVTIGDVERGIMPGSVTFKSVTLTSRPTHPGDVPAVLFLDSVHIDVGILALISMTASVDLDIKMGAGRIKGNIALPKFGRAGFKVDMTASDLSGRSLPLSMIGVPLPIIGKLDASVELEVPVTKTKAGRVMKDWTRAEGTIALACPSGCVLGDGKTKIKPLIKNRTSQAMIADGVDFGKLDIDSLAIEGKFTPAVGDPEAHSSGYKPGKFELEKVDVKSKEGELHVDFALALAPELDESVVTGCLRFNVNDTLLKTEEGKKTWALAQTSGAEKRADGLFHIKLSDHLKDMKRLNLECGPNAKPGPEDNPNAHAGSRPSIHMQPPEPPRPVPAAPPATGSETKPEARVEVKQEPAKPSEAPGSATLPPASAPAEGSEQPAAPEAPQQPVIP